MHQHEEHAEQWEERITVNSHNDSFVVYLLESCNYFIFAAYAVAVALCVFKYAATK